LLIENFKGELLFSEQLLLGLQQLQLILALLPITFELLYQLVVFLGVVPDVKVLLLLFHFAQSKVGLTGGLELFNEKGLVLGCQGLVLLLLALQHAVVRGY
jgi:hypothetical protein